MFNKHHFLKKKFSCKKCILYLTNYGFLCFSFLKDIKILCSMFLYKIDIHTVILKETVLWNIVRWHCKTVVYVSMLCSTEPTKKHSVLMSLLVNGEDPPTGYSVRKPQQHQVRSWVSLTLPYPFQKKGEKDLGPFKAHCFTQYDLKWFDM